MFVIPGINESVFGIDSGGLVKRKERRALIWVNNLSTQIGALLVTKAFLENLGMRRY